MKRAMLRLRIILLSRNILFTIWKQGGPFQLPSFSISNKPTVKCRSCRYIYLLPRRVTASWHSVVSNPLNRSLKLTSIDNGQFFSFSIHPSDPPILTPYLKLPNNSFIDFGNLIKLLSLAWLTHTYYLVIPANTTKKTHTLWHLLAPTNKEIGGVYQNDTPGSYADHISGLIENAYAPFFNATVTIEYVAFYKKSLQYTLTWFLGLMVIFLPHCLFPRA